MVFETNVTGILLQELTVDDGIFKLPDILWPLGLDRSLNFMDLFFNDDDTIISVTCVASNGFGQDDATSHISVCGTTINSEYYLSAIGMCMHAYPPAVPL